MKTSPAPILCATDFSPPAAEAATVAAKLAQRHAASLLLVHVAEVGNARTTVALEKRLETEADRLRKYGAQVESILIDDHRHAAALVAYIKKTWPELVVVGSSVKGAMDRWAFGSVSEEIAESSPVPTLVVRNASTFAAWDWTSARLRLLLALDLHASSDGVLRWARQFQRVGPCDLLACHVNWRTPQWDEATGLSVLANPPALQQRLERDLRKKIRDQLGNEVDSVLVRPFFGDPGPCVVGIARETEAHLIVVGAHQRRGIHRLAQFSVSRDILHQSALNVVCVPVTATFDARAAHIPEYRRVLVATDFSELGNTAVPAACGACAPGGLVRIVHVITPRESRRRERTGAADLRLQLRGLVPDACAGRLQPPEIEVVVHDDIAAGLCAETERFGADLVCLASHGLGASRALHGSVAKAVLKHIRRPLLIVRRPDE